MKHTVKKNGRGRWPVTVDVPDGYRIVPEEPKDDSNLLRKGDLVLEIKSIRDWKWTDADESEIDLFWIGDFWAVARKQEGDGPR